MPFTVGTCSRSLILSRSALLSVLPFVLAILPMVFVAIAVFCLLFFTYCSDFVTCLFCLFDFVTILVYILLLLFYHSLELLLSMDFVLPVRVVVRYRCPFLHGFAVALVSPAVYYGCSTVRYRTAQCLFVPLAFVYLVFYQFTCSFASLRVVGSVLFRVVSLFSLPRFYRCWICYHSIRCSCLFTLFVTSALHLLRCHRC